MLSDERLAALLVLCQQMEHECQAVPRRSSAAQEQECVDTVIRNLTAARKSLERLTSMRWMRGRGGGVAAAQTK